MPARGRACRLVAPIAFLLAPLLAGLAVAGALAERILRPRRSPRLDHRVLAAEPGQALLAADEDTCREGRYGIYFDGGHAVLGPILGLEPGVVRRAVERVDGGALAAGPFGFGHVFVGDPLSAHGLAYREIACPSDAGAMPCWVVDAPTPARGPDQASGREMADTWALLVHGYGGSRASALDMLPMVHRLGMPAICVAYRNDPAAPPSGDRRYHLGATEWRDLDAAMAYAVTSGARRLVLMGWSMGGQIVMQAYERSPHRHVVAGLFLDCPVLDWRAVLTEQGRRRRVPVPVVRAAVRLVELRLRVSMEELDWTTPQRASRIEVPVAIVHGADDRVVPPATSRRLAENAGGAVELEITAGAGHVGSWNVDPVGYERMLQRLSARLTSPQTPFYAA